MSEGSVRFMTRHHVALAPGDVVEFSAALRAEWPTIRFLRQNYFEPLLDHKATYRLDRGAEKGSPRAPWVTVPREEWKVEFYDDLSQPENRLLTAWVVPEGWEPEWGPSDTSHRPGLPIILNKPPFDFMFDRGCFFSSRIRRAQDTPSIIEAETEHVELHCGRVWGRYRKHETEKIRFLRRVFRILGKLTTNRHIQVDIDTGAVNDVIRKGGWTWSGRHAQEWAASHPRHFIFDNFKPFDEDIARAFEARQASRQQD